MADDKASKSNIMWIKKLLNNNITRPRDGKLVDRNAVLNMIKNANIDHQFIFDNIAIIDGVASAINEISLNDYKLVISVKKENPTGL